jgi:hypothetical protein
LSWVAEPTEARHEQPDPILCGGINDSAAPVEDRFHEAAGDTAAPMRWFRVWVMLPIARNISSDAAPLTPAFAAVAQRIV